MTNSTARTLPGAPQIRLALQSNPLQKLCQALLSTHSSESEDSSDSSSLLALELFLLSLVEEEFLDFFFANALLMQQFSLKHRHQTYTLAVATVE